MINNYNINIVNKPWGYEYLAYENEDIALWFLYVKNGQSTSLHCHPKKTTGLILLDGEVEVSFFNHVNRLKPLDKVMIRKGLFHSTKSTSELGSCLFEVETPVDKQDLVRFKDNYGREGKPYEDTTHEIPKKEDCLWIDEPKFGSENIYNFSNTTLKVMSIENISSLIEIEGEVNVMFLKGGLQSDYGQNVAGPGDIVSSMTLKELSKVFTKIAENTIIMIFIK